jgi:hypothetical protein
MESRSGFLEHRRRRRRIPAQAIDLDVDYVAITGTAPTLIQDQIDAAADAGITVNLTFNLCGTKNEGDS